MQENRKSKRFRGKEVFDMPVVALKIEVSIKLHQKLLDTTKSFSKVVVYKVNLEKSVVFLYTNKEQNERI
jgi:hypothetical protein